MKVFTSAIKKESDYSTSYEFRVDKNIEYCCGKMREAWTEHVIGFGLANHYYGNDNEDVNIFQCLAWPEGAAYDEWAIKFCPFCGEPIKIFRLELDGEYELIIGD